MNALDIKKYPQKILRQKCRPIEHMGDQHREFFRHMLFTMRYYKGIGLAAPQVGSDLRLIVADLGNGPVKLANPEVITASGSAAMEEGCLSVPGTMVNVTRSYKAVVKGMNDKGEIVEISAEGLWARVLQHEIDHLNGRLMIDYMGFFPRMRFNLKRRVRHHAYV